MKIKNIKTKLSFLMLTFASVSAQARWFWYEPAPVVVYRQEVSPVEAIVGGVVGAAACVGLGIKALVNFKSKKRKLEEYKQAFIGMGYSADQAKIYAEMALANPKGLEAVMQSIDQKNQVLSENQSQKTLLSESHQQKMQEMSHEFQLKLMTYFATFLMMIATLGVAIFLYRRKK